MTLNAATGTKRCLALLLAMALLFQCGVFLPLTARGATSAKSSGTIMLGNYPIDYQQVLKDNGNGSYTLSLTLKDGASVSAENQNSKVSYNNYFTAPSSGDYLIQLWGGDGGSANGTGGSGGYVYGVVSLTQGQTLYYQLGGDGYASTSAMAGGGANGPGGHAGSNADSSGRVSVGGGGGYSAVYLFDVGEFEANYMDANGNFIGGTITEEHRTTKHIMIAGGGGGGGGGSDSSKPNGGAGGNMDSSAYGTTADGVFFAGSNGMTSGNSTAYVGEGGAEAPGEIQGTVWEWHKGLQANDWARSYSSETPGGSGGAGNFRGGGGGAGYAGGSGGIQTSSWIISNIGGGGGGSSYVSSVVRYGSSLTDSERSAMIASNPSSTGGGVMIQSLSVQNSTALSNLSLSIAPSEYFLLDGSTEPKSITDLNLLGTTQTFDLTFSRKEGFIGGNAVPLTVDDCISVTNGSQSVQLQLDAACTQVNVPLKVQLVTHSYTTNITGITYGIGTPEHCLHETFVGNEFLTINESTVEYSYNSGQIGAPNYTPDTYGTHAYTFNYIVSPKDNKVAEVGTPVVAGTKFSGTAIVKILSPSSQIENTPYSLYTITKNLQYVDNQYVLSIHLTGDYGAEGDGYQMETELIRPPTPTSQTFNYNTNAQTYEAPYDGYYYIQAWGADGGSGGSASNAGDNNHSGVGGYGAYLEGYVYLYAGDQIVIYVGKVGDGGTSGKNSSGGGKGGGYTLVTVARKDNLAQKDVLMIAGGGGGGGGLSSKDNLFNRSFRNGLGRTETYEDLDNGYAGMDLNGFISDENIPALHGSADIVNIGVCNYGGTFSIGDSAALSATYSGQDGADGLEPNLLGGDPGNASAGDAGASYFNNTEHYMNYPPTDEVPTADSYSGYTFTDYRTDHNNNTVNSTKVTNTVTKDGQVRIHGLLMTATEVSTPSEDDFSETEALVISALETHSFSATISRYFTVDDVIVTGVTSHSGFSNTTTPQNETQIDISSLVADISLSRIPATANQPHIVTGHIDYTVSIYLSPHPDFLGGYDVSLLADASVTVPHPNNNKETFALLSLNQTDFANVPLNIPDEVYSDFALTAESVRTLGNQTDEKSEISSASELFTWLTSGNDYDALEDWQKDFVESYTEVTVTETGAVAAFPLAPKNTTVYTVTYGIKPIKDAPEQASVVPTIERDQRSTGVEVIVVPRIKYELTQLSTSDILYDGLNGGKYHQIITVDAPHSATLTTTGSYDLPRSITVTDAYGVDITSSVFYDSVTGQFTIPAEHLFGTLTVSAAAVERTYSIAFYMQPDPDGPVGRLNSYCKTYKAGDTISGITTPAYGDTVSFVITQADGSSQISSVALLPPADVREYYKEEILWSPAPNELPATMPANNITIVGRFVPKDYTLTIQCVDPNGNPLYSETRTLPYGQEHTIEAPVVSSYVPREAYQTVTMEGDQVLTFVYLPTNGMMNVTYHYANGAHPDNTESHNVTAGADDASFTVTVPTGYSIAQIRSEDGLSFTQTDLTVNFVAPEDVSDGLAFTVILQPKTYTVNFLPAGGSVTPTTMRVEYDRNFGYDADAERTVGLPTPYFSGKEFLGWYYEDTLITAETLVSATSGIAIMPTMELEARWKDKDTKVTIRFADEDGKVLASDVVFTGAPGTNGVYTIPNKQITVGGTTYTTDQTEVTYFFITQNRVIVVTYYAPKQLSVYYRDAQTGDLIDKVSPNPSQSYHNVGDTYTVVCPTIDNYTLFGDAQITGTMGTTDAVVNVYYTKENTRVVHVTIDWSDLTFEYDYGIWNTQTHSYNPTVNPSAKDQNVITVTSGEASTILLDIALSYEKATGYDDLTGYYTTGTNRYSQQITGWTLLPTESKKAYFWLRGTVSDAQKGKQDLTVGRCVVTVQAPPLGD